MSSEHDDSDADPDFIIEPFPTVEPNEMLADMDEADPTVEIGELDEDSPNPDDSDGGANNVDKPQPPLVSTVIPKLC